MQEKYPFDVCIYNEHTDYDFAEEKALTEKYAKITDFLAYEIYQDHTNSCNRYLTEALSENDTYYYSCFKYDTYMRLSDYNRLRQMLHLEPVSLQQDQYLIQTKRRLKKHCCRSPKPLCTFRGRTMSVPESIPIPLSKADTTVLIIYWSSRMKRRPP